MPDFERKYLRAPSNALYLDRNTAVICPIFITAVSTFYNHIGCAEPSNLSVLIFIMGY